MFYLFNNRSNNIHYICKSYAKKQENEGKQTPVLLISVGLLAILPLLSFLLGGSSFS